MLVLLLNKHFERLHRNSIELIRATPAEKIYLQPCESRIGSDSCSCGEYVLRSAGAVEQTFGGITTNLWDDPFEWTLPETLSTRDQIVEYLGEVEATRSRGFDLFRNDSDLLKEIVVPSGKRQTLYDLLLATLVRASRYQGCAFATFKLFDRSRNPGI